MCETWAFLDSGYHDAATNMAIDEALLDWHSEGKIRPVIRFYGWKKPTLSVGHFQNIDKTIDFDGVQQHHCDFVRRLTGGSAVLHDDELTYSIIVNESHPFIPHSVNDAYQVLADGLLKGYQSLEIDATFAHPKRERSGDRSAVCFETPAIYEILAKGKKISGNAQTRKKGVLLQHGSLPIRFNAKMLFDLFQFRSEDHRIKQHQRFSEKATSIYQETGIAQDYNSLVPIFLDGFQKSLHIETEALSLSDAFWAHVAYLRDTKYTTASWNKRLKKVSGSVDV